MVSLTKGERISLEKTAGTSLKKVIMGLGWDPVKSGGFLSGLMGGSDGGSIDLDASCLMFDDEKKLVDTVWFRQLRSHDGSVRHSGDNLTGQGEGDDERITVDIEKLPAKVNFLVFTVNSFTGQSFERVANASCRLLNAENNKEIAKFNLSAQGRHTAQIMAVLYSHNNEWKMHALGEIGEGRTFEALVPQIVNHL